MYSLENAERQSLSNDFQYIADRCSAIGLRIASGTAADVQKWLIKASDITNVYVVSEITNIQRTIVFEMTDNLFLYIPSDRSKQYLEPLTGWQEVVDKLPQVVSDVKEANICFACGLYAGAVFHTTLVLEAGVVALGRLLQINDPKMGWNSVTREVARIIKANYKTLNIVEQQHFGLVQQLDPLIESMKNSWRHKITHVENKLVLLTGEFNDRTAEEIMIAARAFMRRLIAEL